MPEGIIVPKTPEQQLKQLIDATKTFYDVAKTHGKLKSNPLVAMYRDGELTFEFVMKEIELIRQRKSRLSAGKRNAVIALVGTAISQFQKDNKMKSQTKS